MSDRGLCCTAPALAADAALPGDGHPGDRAAIAVAGAHHRSTASSCDAVGRPPVVAVHDGRGRLLIRRESLADINGRDVGL